MYWHSPVSRERSEYAWLHATKQERWTYHNRSLYTSRFSQNQSLKGSGNWTLVSHGVTHTITEVCTQAGFLKINPWKWQLEISITWSDTYHNRTLYTSRFLKIDIWKEVATGNFPLVMTYHTEWHITTPPQLDLPFEVNCRSAITHLQVPLAEKSQTIANWLTPILAKNFQSSLGSQFCYCGFIPSLLTLQLYSGKQR